MSKYTWKVTDYRGRRLISEPRRFFITQYQRNYKTTTKLWAFDGTANGYSIVSCCTGLREAKKLAEA